MKERTRCSRVRSDHRVGWLCSMAIDLSVLHHLYCISVRIGEDDVCPLSNPRGK